MAPQAPITAAPSAPGTEDAAWAGVIEGAKREQKVMLYTFLFTEELPRNIEKGFSLQHPYIKLDFLPMASAVRLERIKAEQRQGMYIANTSDGSATFQWNLRKDGMSQPAGDMPAIKDKGARTA